MLSRETADSSSFARRLGLHLGMPATQVRDLLGEPSEVLFQPMAGHLCEKWDYEEESLILYFRSDMLKSWRASGLLARQLVR